MSAQPLTDLMQSAAIICLALACVMNSLGRR
ncbi:hypothetical protein J2X35_003971 [Mesorhizobium sp. BE184]|nr:hypothetical protein [Mesorhizobium sp. BE184]